MDLDELMDALGRLDGTHVGLSSTGAIHVVGTLRVAVARSRALPRGVVLTDELLESLPTEPTDLVTGFHVGDSATVMLIRKLFVSAEVSGNGIDIELEHESLRVSTFQEGPPYAPQTIDLR